MTERTFAALVVGGLFAATPASADLLMNFQDNRDDGVSFYIAFGTNIAGGDTFTATGTVNGEAGTTINPNQSYLYSESGGSSCLGTDTLCGPIDITQASPNARVLLSLGNGLTIANDGSANFANPDPGNAAQLLDFQTRWDKFEFDYSAGSGGANLTSTDFFGLPMQLTTTQASHPSQTLTWNYSSTVNTTTVFSTLGAQAGYSLDQKPNDGVHNLGAIVANGNNGVTITKPDGTQIPGVVRIIAPTSTNAGQTPFPSFAPYLNYIETNQIKTNIAGQNGEYNNEWQNYNFTAYISDKTTTSNGLAVNPGDLVLEGTVSGEAFTIVVAASELSVYNVYGANVEYSASGPDAHNIAEKALADYFAGLNFGFIGSPELNPNCQASGSECFGETIGGSPSWTWYGNIPGGGYFPKLPLSDAYAVAQPDNTYYNQYASYLNKSNTPVTDSYGFPYTDRLASPLANLYSDTTLTVTLLADDPSGGLGSPAPVPEPSTWVMMGLGFVGLAFMGARAQRKRALSA